MGSWEDITCTDIMKWKHLPNLPKETKPQEIQDRSHSVVASAVSDCSFSRSKEVGGGFLHLPLLYGAMTVFLQLCTCVCVRTHANICEHSQARMCGLLQRKPP